ncbi:MAG: cysteinyl-tRNA synthetase [Kiritimatiellia bacterium]|jgi:cysteinyl-tRNA synthetase
MRSPVLRAAQLVQICTLGVGLLSAGCTRGPTVTVDPTALPPESAAAPVCVWNQAYQENYQPDSVSEMLARAQGCYTLIDPFEDPAAQAAINDLKAADNTVACYISVGTCEDWRDDYNAIRGYCTTKEWGEWKGEYFVDDVQGILPHMQARVETLADWGCDMVEFDNMDWADEAEKYRLNVTLEQSVDYYQALCDTVHAAGMGCMAKSTRHEASNFDGGTFESSPNDLDWWQHDHLQSFVDQGQLAIIFHYDEPNCDDVTLWYRQRYGAGLSVLCEDPAARGYRH